MVFKIDGPCGFFEMLDGPRVFVCPGCSHDSALPASALLFELVSRSKLWLDFDDRQAKGGVTSQAAH